MQDDLWAEIDGLMTEVGNMGIEIAPGMPVPDDDAHARMAVRMLSQLVSAHKAGRHTPFCRCGLSRPAETA